MENGYRGGLSGTWKSTQIGGCSHVVKSLLCIMWLLGRLDTFDLGSELIQLACQQSLHCNGMKAAFRGLQKTGGTKNTKESSSVRLVRKGCASCLWGCTGSTSDTRVEHFYNRIESVWWVEMGSGIIWKWRILSLGSLVDVGLLTKMMIVRGEIELWGRWHTHFWIFWVPCASWTSRWMCSSRQWNIRFWSSEDIWGVHADLSICDGKVEIKLLGWREPVRKS